LKTTSENLAGYPKLKGKYAMKQILTAILLINCCFATQALASDKQFFMKGQSGLCLAAKGQSNLELSMEKCTVSPRFLINLGPNGTNIIFPMLDSNTVRCAHVEQPESIELPQTVTANNCDNITFWANVFTQSGQKFVLQKDFSSPTNPAVCLEEQGGTSPIVVNFCDNSKPKQRWTLIEAVAP
jgi:hypothetical protein